MTRLLAEETGIVVSFLLKLLLGLAMVAVVVIDGGSVLINRVQADDLAQSAADEAAHTFERTGSVSSAVAAADRVVEEQGGPARLVRRRFEVRPDGSVAVTVVRTARTLVLQHIRFFDRVTTARGSGVGRPSLL